MPQILNSMSNPVIRIPPGLSRTDLDAVAKCEPLIRIGRDGRVERHMPDNNAGSRRNDRPNVLVVAVPKFDLKRLDSAIMCLTHTLNCLLKLENAGIAEPAATASDLWAMP